MEEEEEVGVPVDCLTCASEGATLAAVFVEEAAAGAPASAALVLLGVVGIVIRVSWTLSRQ